MRGRALGWIVAACAASYAPPAVAEPQVSECITASEKAQTDRDEGRVVRAREELVACANAACPAAVRAECLKWLDEVEASVPTIVFVVRDAAGADLGDVVVRVDGAVLASRLDGRALAVEPGEHTFAFERGAWRAEGRAIVHVAEKNRVVRVRLADEGSAVLGDAPFREPPSSRPVPVASAVLAGLAVVGAASALVLWSSARSDLTSLEASPCAATRTCAASDVQSVRARLLVGDVLMAAGGVALGASLWIWLTRSTAVDVRASGARFTTYF